MEDILNTLLENGVGFAVVLIPFIKALTNYIKETFNLEGVLLQVVPMVVGLVVMLSIGLYANGDLGTFILAGVMSGLASSGYYDLGATIKKENTDGK